MPYGHNRQYLDLVREAEQKRIFITKTQQKEIRGAYREIASDLARELRKHSESTLTYRWLKDYGTALREGSKALYGGITATVSDGIQKTAEAVTGAQRDFYSALVPDLSQRFRDVFSSIPQQAVNELMSGGIYRDFSGLSERIWDYRRKYDRDISTIINRGILAQKPAYELAKDLERYLDPSAQKPWDWNRVYPGVHRQVDYNAQRLARTSVTHAYQLSFQRATKDNPFVERYQWLSSNSARVCPLCAERDGRYYEKDALPLDHPNGMCTVVAVIEKSSEEIAAELADWALGGENPALDRWLTPSSGKERGAYSINIKRIGTNAVDLEYIKSQAFRKKFNQISEHTGVNKALREYATAMLTHRNGTDGEDLYIIDSQTGNLLLRKISEKNELEVGISESELEKIRSQAKGSLVGIHNHPTNIYPTGSDFAAAGYRQYRFGVVVTHDGRVFQYTAGDKPFLPSLFDDRVDKYTDQPYNLSVAEAHKKVLDEFKEEYKISWNEIK